MCAVSMVYDSYRDVPHDFWSQPKVDEFKQIIERLDRLDKALGLPECHDPAKAKWLKDLETRIDKLEKTVGDDQSKPEA